MINFSKIDYQNSLIKLYSYVIQEKELCYSWQSKIEKMSKFLSEEISNLFSNIWKLNFNNKIHTIINSSLDKVYLYHIDGYYITDNWQWCKMYLDGVNLVEDCTINIQSVKEFIEEWNKIFPWKIQVCFKHIKTKEDFESWKDISSYRDLEIYFSEFQPQLIEKGEIKHLGWDIFDYFYIVKFNDSKIRILYSTNAHGFGLDNLIEPSENFKLDNFYLFAKNAVKISKEEIIKSWL